MKYHGCRPVRAEGVRFAGSRNAWGGKYERCIPLPSWEHPRGDAAGVHEHRSSSAGKTVHGSVVSDTRFPRSSVGVDPGRLRGYTPPWPKTGRPAGHAGPPSRCFHDRSGSRLERQAGDRISSREFPGVPGNIPGGYCLKKGVLTVPYTGGYTGTPPSLRLRLPFNRMREGTLASAGPRYPGQAWGCHPDSRNIPATDECVRGHRPLPTTVRKTGTVS